MNHLTVQTEDTFACLLELAANNDVQGIRVSIERDPSCVDESGLWYGRHKGSKTMMNDERTPLMVAATYGNVDVIKLILSMSHADVNRSCGSDKTTALHCAASGGAANAVEVVKLLLAAGADANVSDAYGHRACDVIITPPKLDRVKLLLQELLSNDGSAVDHSLWGSTNSNSNLNSYPAEHESLEDYSPVRSRLKENGLRKEYPVDPSIPDIKNSIYSTDEFRMYSFKVRPCSRAYSHDWTECPFVHPGENARRRDPRKFHYSCVPCPDFRKGACRRGDMCEYAHGVFECWLHPAQYRTRLCKDGTGCARRVCFFAHTPEELRPLYVSTGSAFPSPCSNADFAAAMSLLPGSPSSVSVLSPSPFTPPMSPSTANGMSHSNMVWPQPNVPALHLPGSSLSLQSSRLRSSVNARDIPTDGFNMFSDFDQQQQQLNEFTGISSNQQPPLTSNSLSRSGRFKSLAPSNLDDVFSAEGSSSSSPRFTDPALASAVFSPTHKSAVFNQFQQQQQSMLSPINTGFSPKNADHAFLQARMSPRNMEPISPMGSRVSSLLAAQHREKQQQQQYLRSLSSRELVGSHASSWSRWGSSDGKPDWAMGSDDFGRLRRSSSFEVGNGDEPDLSWVQSLVKESPGDGNKDSISGGVSDNSAGLTGSGENGMEGEPVDHAMLGAWIEQMQLDQLVAQQN